MRVFLSYRRDDAGGHAGRLSDALSERLGAGSVFHDVTAIGPGLNFDHEIDRALDECDAVLALIGPAWLDAASSDGSRRLFASDDYVRRELARALTRDVPLVPVLVGGARLPSEEELPDSIAALSQRQQVILQDESWHNDVNGLVRSLRREPLRPRRRRWPTLLGIVLATIVVVGAVLWFVRRDASSLGPCEPPGD